MIILNGSCICIPVDHALLLTDPLWHISQMYIGREANGGGYLTGNMKDIRFYAVVLTYVRWRIQYQLDILPFHLALQSWSCHSRTDQVFVLSDTKPLPVTPDAAMGTGKVRFWPS